MVDGLTPYVYIYIYYIYIYYIYIYIYYTTWIEEYRPSKNNNFPTNFGQGLL